MASPTRRLLTDFGYLVAGHAFVRLVGFAATLYVTAALGPDEFGGLALGLALATVFSVCANLGLDDLLLRQVARDAAGARTLLGDAIVLKLLALPVGVLGAAGLAVVRPQAGALYLWLLLYATALSYLLLAGVACRGRRRMDLHSLLMGLYALLAAAGGAAGAALSGRASAVAAGYALAATLAVGAGYAVLRRTGVPPRYSWLPGRWRATLRTALPFAAALLGLMVFDRVALVTTGVLLGSAAAGWFGAAYTIVLGLTTLPGLAVAAVYPILARTAAQHGGGDGAAAAVAAPLLLFAAGGGLALAGGVFLLAPAVVPRLYGPAYLPSLAVLQTLALGLPGLFLVIVLTAVLEGTDRQRDGAAAVGAGLLLAVPLCAVSTRWWGLAGAAVAYDVSNTLLAGIMLVLGARALGPRHLWAAARRWCRPFRPPALRPAAGPA
jgi:O-antigen/teichoic acid export membrane protein